MANRSDYALPFALLTIGGMLAYSGFKGKSLISVFGGDIGKTLDPAGGSAPVPEGDSSSSSGGSGATGDLKAIMDQVTATNSKYKWGGGHDKPLKDLTVDTEFDCSGSVCFALYKAGFYTQPMAVVSGALALPTQGRKLGKGSKFTIYANPSHVFLRDEGSGKDWSTTHSHGECGPTGCGPRWINHPTSAFVATHYEGM